MTDHPAPTTSDQVISDLAADLDPPRPVPAATPATWSRGWWSGMLPVPTPRFAAVTVVAALGLVAAPVLWPVVVLLLLGLGVLDASLTPAPWTVPVARSHRQVVALGASTTWTWVFANSGTRATTIVLTDHLVPSLGATSRRAVVAVGGREQVSAATTLTPSRRGRFVPTDLVIRLTGPMGLVTRQHLRELPSVLEVHPTFRSRKEAELRITRGRILDSGLRSARALGRGTEFEQLREYTPDDEFRRMDWAATARTGTPTVRTYRAEQNQTVQILLDTGRTMAGLVQGVPRLDHAMDAVMALGTVATRLGDKAGLVAFSSQVRAIVPPQGDRQQVMRLTRAMYRLEPDLTESDYDLAVTRTVAIQRRRALLVLLTELASESLPETLIPALPLLLQHHIVMIGAVRDPEVEKWRTDRPDDVGGAFRAAGAATVTRARTRTAALLQRMGVMVVDAPPGELAGALADAYLGVKATGRL